MLADVFITTKGRPELFRRSLESFIACTYLPDVRLTIVDDGDYTGTQDVIQDHEASVDHVLRNIDNRGLGPSVNMALAHIDALKRWDGIDAPPLTIGLQDDILYTPGWLGRLAPIYMQLKRPLKLAFASGIECPEHPVRDDLGNGMVTKDWLRMTCLLATHDVWMDCWPIPKVDAETGRERGRPHDGLGSGVDWHFIRVHPKSVCRTGRTNLVIPGLLRHMGYRESTWLRRDLPESEADRKAIG